MVSGTCSLRRIMMAVFVGLLAIGFSLPASSRAEGIAIVEGDEPLMSDNVSLLGTVPIVGAISANFRDNFMFVSGVEGLSTFDISDPSNPALTSFTALPHFENEDVSLGGNLLLIANDNAESVGILIRF